MHWCSFMSANGPTPKMSRSSLDLWTTFMFLRLNLSMYNFIFFLLYWVMCNIKECFSNTIVILLWAPVKFARFLQFFGLPSWVAMYYRSTYCQHLLDFLEFLSLLNLGNCLCLGYISLFFVRLHVHVQDWHVVVSLIHHLQHMCHYSLLYLYYSTVFFFQRRSSYVSRDWRKTGHQCFFCPFVLLCFTFWYLRLFMFTSPQCIHWCPFWGRDCHQFPHQILWTN
jgi:hypothetical protein